LDSIIRDKGLDFVQRKSSRSCQTLEGGCFAALSQRLAPFRLNSTSSFDKEGMGMLVTGQEVDAIRWYALQTRPKHEKMVSNSLAGKGYEEFLPMYQSWHRSGGRMKGVPLPLFPGYVFCRFDRFRRLPILMTPGVFGIVNGANGPEAISDGEIGGIQASCTSGLRISPWPYLETGDHVRVEFGPLQGVEGIFLAEKNCSRLIVSIEILKRSVSVEVNRDWVHPLTRRSVMQARLADPSTSHPGASSWQPNSAA
jgi:transcription antitermination factor NusG